MLISEQIINGLDGVECAYGHFYEDSAPIAHGSIPQARQLKCLELLAVLTLRADEASIVVDMLEEVEAITFIVLGSTNEVNRIEVSTLGKHLHVLLVVLVNL